MGRIYDMIVMGGCAAGRGLFVSIGRKPLTERVKDRLTLAGAGDIMAGEDTRINISGVCARSSRGGRWGCGFPYG